MKAVTLAAATLAVLSTPVLAGGPTIVEPDPMPAAAPALEAAHDWSGPYVGLSYGRTSSDITFSTTGLFETEDGTIRGLYAGYLMQRGNLVYGGELAYGKINDAVVPGFPTSEFVNALDLKGRVGLASNRALFYGALGFSKVDFDDTSAVNFDMSGLNYGIGAEVSVTQSLTVGLEYLMRDVDGESDLLSTTTGDANLDSISLRIGLSF